MCGQYKVTPGEFSDLRLRFNLKEIPLFKPRYNIAPTQQAPVGQRYFYRQSHDQRTTDHSS